MGAIQKGIISKISPPTSTYLNFDRVNQDNIIYNSVGDKWSTIGDFDMEVNFMMKEVVSKQLIFSYYRSSSGNFEIYVENNELLINVSAGGTNYLMYQVATKAGESLNVKVLNSIYTVNGIQVADLTANAGAALNVLTNNFVFGQREANALTTSSNVYLVDFYINGKFFPCDEGSGYTVTSTTFETATGSTINVGGLTYWDNEVWRVV